MIVNKNVNFYYEKSQNFDIIEVTKIKEIKYYERNHSSQLTAHADYVIGRVFCQPLKQAFSRFCEEAFYAPYESGVA